MEATLSLPISSPLQSFLPSLRVHLAAKAAHCPVNGCGRQSQKGTRERAIIITAVFPIFLLTPDGAGRQKNGRQPAIDGTTGEIKVLPPSSKAGDYVSFRAEMDVVIGMTACSALQSNGGSFKPIWYRIDD